MKSSPAIYRVLLCFCGLALACQLAGRAASPPSRVLDPRQFHLGVAGSPEWDEFAGQLPDGNRLDIRFQSQSNTQPWSLLLRQDDVKQDWQVELNGHKLGTLFTMEAPLVHILPIPAGSVIEGTNVLSFLPPAAPNDIRLSGITLYEAPQSELMSQAFVEVRVADTTTTQPLPCRITITDQTGALAAVFPDLAQKLAARPGVVYALNGQAQIGLLPGEYTLYATRGFEYGVAQQKVTVSAGQTPKVELKIQREVATPGWVAMDPHVHTRTESGHGDATVEERLITLAGEGIEVPVATEHNKFASYARASAALGTTNWLTPIAGSEITTAAWHLNIFPVAPDSTVPDSLNTHWPSLLRSLRGTPGVQVVSLNHPRNIHHDFQPFAATNFNPVTGQNLRGEDFSMDALEVVNSSAMQSDWMLSFHDWFAVLNDGHRTTGLGSSDVHDVSRYIVGQGRSYVRAADADPGKVNVEEVCKSIQEGRVLVSLGLLTTIEVDGRYSVGDLATNLPEDIRVSVAVWGPSWVNADRVELYANGVKIREQVAKPVKPVKSRKPSPTNSGSLKLSVTWEIPKPHHDTFLVAIASGPGVTAPYWALAKPYQPSSRAWHPAVIGATNPVWLDGDGDGKFTSARNYAESLVRVCGTHPNQIIPALAHYDEAIAAQAASLCRKQGVDLRSPEYQDWLQRSGEQVQRGFAALLRTSP